MEMQEQDYSTMIVPLKKDHCTLCGGYTSLDVNADGSLLAECHLCELSNSIESQEQIQVYF
ncbi:hypothetical protein JCM19233_5657 [Vibrio astriarenae]|nr:hypothetical protein JCM19233_5657 [Vibrio sp. C7]